MNPKQALLMFIPFLARMVFLLYICRLGFLGGPLAVALRGQARTACGRSRAAQDSKGCRELCFSSHGAVAVTPADALHGFWPQEHLAPSRGVGLVLWLEGLYLKDAADFTVGKTSSPCRTFRGFLFQVLELMQNMQIPAGAGTGSLCWLIWIQESGFESDLACLEMICVHCAAFHYPQLM